MKVIASGLLVIGAAGLAMPLAAQEVVRPASDSVEIEITATGIAEVPAQGYSLTAFLRSRPRGADDTPALVRQLESMEAPAREACHPAYPFGLVGNEVLEAAVNADGINTSAAGEEGSEEQGSADGWTIFAPSGYSGQFATRAALTSAQELLREHGQAAGSVQPLLFDCVEATERARLDALARSRREVEPLAEALGLRVMGVSRIEAGDADANLRVFSALTASNNDQDRVRVQASLRVIYRLAK